MCIRDSIYTADIGVHISSSGAVCFSKDGSYFNEKNKLEDSQNPNQTLEGRLSNNYIIICPKSTSGGLIVGGSSGSCGTSKPQYLVEWSRFGNISKFKWSGSAWSRQ